MLLAILIKILREIENSKNIEIYQESSFNCLNEGNNGVQIGKIKKFKNSRYQILIVFSATFPTAGMKTKFFKIEPCTVDPSCGHH